MARLMCKQSPVLQRLRQDVRISRPGKLPFPAENERRRANAANARRRASSSITGDYIWAAYYVFQFLRAGDLVSGHQRHETAPGDVVDGGVYAQRPTCRSAIPD